MGVALKRSRRDLAIAVAIAGLGAAAWLLLASGGGAGTARASHGKPLDHFLCYRGQFNPNTPVGANIALKDQFAQQPISHGVGAPQWFCNPARKFHQGVGLFPIVHPDNHLTAYGLNGTVPLKRLRVNNQFQRSTSTSPPNLVTDPGTTAQPKRPLILVPTRKTAPLHPAPANINHFKCYPTRPTVVNQQVQADDQFGQGANIQVRNAVLICNPAVKRHGPNTFPIQHQGQHLVCYTITAPPFTRPVQLRNQFGPRQLQVNQRFLLCVPSRKAVVP